MGVSVIEKKWEIIPYWKQDNMNKMSYWWEKDKIQDVISVKYELLLTL